MHHSQPFTHLRYLNLHSSHNIDLKQQLRTRQPRHTQQRTRRAMSPILIHQRLRQRPIQRHAHLLVLNGKAVGLMLGNSVPCGNSDSAITSTTAIPIQLLESLSGDSEIGVEPLLSFWVYISVV